TASLLLAGGVAAFVPAPAELPVRAAIEQRIAASGAEVAVAFRTLDSRDELFLRSDVSFHAASTMKVPVMIELYRQARGGDLRLADQIPVVNEFHSIVDGSPFALDASDDSDATVYKRAGGRMSYRELCEAMITVSSNLATNLLIERLGPKHIQATTEALGAGGRPVPRGGEDGKGLQKGLDNTPDARPLLMLMEKIARDEAVERAASDEMIAVLKRQTFNDRIPAGLPHGVAVAHKTGEITRIQHDAAIVYGPRPFALVVLVRGIDDAKTGSALIADIARIIYAATVKPSP